MNKMKIFTGEQRSFEWFLLRQSRFTSSNATAVKANGKGLETLCREKAIEIRFGREKFEPTPVMQLGIDNEDTARMLYELETGNNVTEIGFIYDDLKGDSPDGVIYKDDTIIGCIEIKHKIVKNYLDYNDTMKINSDHYNQMQWHLWCSEADWCDYIVYNYKIDNIIIQRMYPEPKYFEAFEIGLQRGVELLKEELSLK